MAGAVINRHAGYSFSAGPAMLPDQVLAEIHHDLPDWRGTGFSVLETSQWDPGLLDMFDKVEADLRALLAVPDDYAVFFLHGGASNQFAMVPMNLLLPGGTATYLHTGMWSGKAITEARRYGDVRVGASTAEGGFRRAPSPAEVELDERAAYLHYTPSETGHGVQFDFVPESADVPLVTDASSALFTTHIDVGRFGVVYASTQKNIGVVGMTLVLVRRDLIGRADPRTPTTFDYAVHQRTSSRFTTPPVFCWYVTGLMVAWMSDQGGVDGLCRASKHRADIVYSTLDRSNFYDTLVERDSRATSSIPFRLADDDLTDTFLADAAKAGLHGLRGHASVGGLRACLFVGMPERGAVALAEFLADFEARYG